MRPDAALIAIHRRPGLIELARDEVHVWHAALEATDAVRLAATLSPDEHERAARFRFARDRDRFVATRGLVRVILGRYLGRAPETLRFRYGLRGKPSLSPACGGDELRFNVSHADDLALVAIARGREVGVDVERPRENLALDSLIATCCSPPEVATLSACQPQERHAAFFASWTSKEAYAKGVGDGLHLPLDRLTVHFAAAGGPIQLSMGETRIDDWTVRSVQVAPGYAAAVAAEGNDWTLSCRGRW